MFALCTGVCLQHGAQLHAALLPSREPLLISIWRHRNILLLIRRLASPKFSIRSASSKAGPSFSTTGPTWRTLAPRHEEPPSKRLIFGLSRFNPDLPVTYYRRISYVRRMGYFIFINKQIQNAVSLIQQSHISIFADSQLACFLQRDHFNMQLNEISKKQSANIVCTYRPRDRNILVREMIYPFATCVAHTHNLSHAHFPARRLMNPPPWMLCIHYRSHAGAYTPNDQQLFGYALATAIATWQKHLEAHRLVYQIRISIAQSCCC